MTATIIDLTKDDDVRKLATPATILLGHEIAKKGEVALGISRPELVEAITRMDGMTTRRAKFELKDGTLSWRCTCTSSSKFCKHLVAAALGVQKEMRGDIYKVAGIIIKDRKLLHERSEGKPAFIAPGGRTEDGETATQGLIRELKEECTIHVDEADLAPFGTFSAEAANHPGQQVHMQVFTVKKWQGTIRAGAEVAELRWLTSDLPSDIEVGSISAHEIIPRLKAENLID